MPDYTHLTEWFPEVFGALFVAAVGFYQWRRKYHYPGRASSEGSRRKAAADLLWAKLEDANFWMRDCAPGGGQKQMPARLKDLNAAFLKNSPYLEESVQSTVGAYVNALHQVAALLRDNVAPATVDWVDTAILPIASGNPALVSALQDLARQREIVKGALLRAAD